MLKMNDFKNYSYRQGMTIELSEKRFELWINVGWPPSKLKNADQLLTIPTVQKKF
jgi:hypothetical protein